MPCRCIVCCLLLSSVIEIIDNTSLLRNSVKTASQVPYHCYLKKCLKHCWHLSCASNLIILQIRLKIPKHVIKGFVHRDIIHALHIFYGIQLEKTVHEAEAHARVCVCGDMPSVVAIAIVIKFLSTHVP